jgi:hypothetical protein
VRNSNSFACSWTQRNAARSFFVAEVAARVVPESRGFVVKYFPKIGTLLVSRSERWESKERSGASRTYDRAFSSSPDDVRDALTDDRRDSALIDNASRILALCRAICL